MAACTNAARSSRCSKRSDCSSGVPCTSRIWSRSSSPVTLLISLLVLLAPGRSSDRHDRAYEAARRGGGGAAEDAPVGVFAEAGRQRLALHHPVGAATVGLALGPQEQGVIHPRLVESLRQVEQVGDEEDLDARFDQGTDDLPGDLGALPLVGGRKRLVAEQDGAGCDLVGDGGHP